MVEKDTSELINDVINIPINVFVAHRIANAGYEHMHHCNFTILSQIMLCAYLTFICSPGSMHKQTFKIHMQFKMCYCMHVILYRYKNYDYAEAFSA